MKSRASTFGVACVAKVVLLVAAACRAEGSATGAAERSTSADRHHAATLHRIAFGSCASQNRPQPIWDTVLAAEPDLFLFLGDNVYADTTDPEALRAAYDALADQPGYQRLRRACPIFATWDDHDYGINDGGAEHPHRAAAQRVFLEFFQEPADSPRWKREGVYGSQTFGPPGQRVQVILLDTRYHRGPLSSVRVGGRKLYLPNPDPDVPMLGEAQWQWLGEQLRQPADVRLIGSSIQVIPTAHPFEKWANLPHERQRLLDLLDETGANGVILLSGDQHLGELSHLPRENSYDLHELTASGLTHTRGGIPAPNLHRIGDFTLDHHFGLIEIDWQADDPRITLSIVTLDGERPIVHTLRLSELQR